jgi:tRNA/rRNA methyltransferase
MTSVQSSIPGDVSNIVIVLDRPRNPLNIGAVIRAMMNMGFTSLRMVNPKQPLDREHILRVAHRGEELLDSAQIFDNLDDALADVTFVVGTSRRASAGKPFTNDVEAVTADLSARAATAPVALMFGTEPDGLDNHALDRCHMVASLPVNPIYPSLNLAQAVLIFLYELRRAVHANPASPAYAEHQTLTPQLSSPQGSAPRALTPHEPTTQADLERLFSMTEEMLHEANYFRYNPEFVMRTLRDLVFRAQPAHDETAMLVSIVRRVLYELNERGDG